MLDFWQYEFMRNAVYAGLLVSVACGIVGVYVVVNRIVFISGGIAHSSFGGIGLGFLAGFSPVLGALAFALGSALGIGLITRRTRLPEDTTIGILWTVGMALGIIFVGLAPGYAPDLFSYLFGNILFVPPEYVRMTLLLDVAIVSIVLLLYNEFQAVSFDEQFAELMGIRVELIFQILLVLIALAIVTLMRVVGVILVIALLTVPAAIGRQWSESIRRMMALAVVIGAVVFNMRQQRLELMHEITGLQSQMNRDRQATWDTQVRIAKRTGPDALREALARTGLHMEPAVIQRDDPDGQSTPFADARYER